MIKILNAKGKKIKTSENLKAFDEGDAEAGKASCLLHHLAA